MAYRERGRGAKRNTHAHTYNTHIAKQNVKIYTKWILLPAITLFARDSVHKTCPINGWQQAIYLSMVKLTVK